MEEIEIEKMTLAHFEQIKNVLTIEFDEFWNENLLRSELENGSAKYIVAIFNEEIVGFAGIKYSYDNYVEIMNIVTKKSKRQSGVGKKMLISLINLSKEYNVQKICLEVNENNLPAINLYNNMGFKEVGRRKGYYNGNFDAILMDYIL